MSRCLLPTLLLPVLALVGVAAAPQDEKPAPGPVFKLSVSLVQLDAVVTDRKGHHVTDLGPADFVVLQDGKVQPVTAVAYVRAEEPLLDENGAPVVSVPVSPRNARRVIGLVVDDARMSFESMYHARTALRRFVDEGLLPDDLVSLVTTSGGPNSSWPFTYSRAELRAATNRLRYALWNARATSAVDALDGSLASRGDGFEGTVERTYALKALDRVGDVINAVRQLPGRKTVVLVSEGFSMFGPGDVNSLVREAMHRLVDRANRAGVVVYTVDPRGLVVTGLSAADSPRGAREAMEIAGRRSAALLETQDALRFVAGQTGGFAVVNNNDLRGALGRVMDDQRGYYLVGYQPDAATFARDPRHDFRSVKIKVTRKGLRVRTRAGFYPVPTE